MLITGKLLGMMVMITVTRRLDIVMILSLRKNAALETNKSVIVLYYVYAKAANRIRHTQLFGRYSVDDKNPTNIFGIFCLFC